MKTEPLLYYKSKKDIQAYLRVPVRDKLKWLEAQMEFFYKTMPGRSKRMRELLKRDMR